VIPFGRYSDRPIYSLMQAALLATVLAILLASLVAWRITRPISKVVDASRELARGNMPSPLQEDGPRELAALARGFNHMASALDSAARERRLMLAGLSHDLRTPLTRLKLMLELQDSSPTPRTCWRISTSCRALCASSSTLPAPRNRPGWSRWRWRNWPTAWWPALAAAGWMST
jgi:signal transduction histidine kinase